ncbi:DUF2207 domain-containing protein [Jeotgalibacillus proteolyticus]|uniref:DUF2207 domain-containing protein n=1 Tax=Jeotgalibacillus proteolyticus TaxID=2082395 RepID=A0A2S5GBZ3_9BACL|nr:DUF2207 domain-containing protein [Jeotgalibacillus proteolyticus]PPA70435.1 hypothetical protein C4B60_12745 [Jeotgalibacillus proteolyticus]
MHKAKVLLIVLAGLFLFFPVQALAVEYEIDETVINAYLTEDGDVNVSERHVYTFEDEFNGIMRELRPKSNAAIENVEATEGDQPLKVEQDGDLYRIYRSGDDETIEVELTYTITGGLEVYEDMVQFYWPFFDRSNESTYEKLTISLFPPAETDDVIAFGYDEAFETEEIGEDGSVVFEFGTVPDGKNGDVRAAWNAEIFAMAPTEKGELREDLLSEQQKGIEEGILFTERRELISTIGIAVMAVLALLLTWVILRGVTNAKRLRENAAHEIGDDRRIPPERMTLAATISYLKTFLPREVIPASLLDLVRKGNVVQLDDQTYKVVQREGLKTHEEILIEWLFEEIGDSGELHLEQLEAYTKNEKNHETYQKYDAEWQTSIKQEIKENVLYQDKVNHRVKIGLTSLVLIPLFVLFPLFDLLPHLFFSILLAGGLITYAVAYSPRTEKGHLIFMEWNGFNNQYADVSESEWEDWTEDEKMRSYLYSFGTNDKKLKDKNDRFVSTFEMKNGYGSTAAVAAPLDVHMLALYSVTAGASFHTANETVSSSSSSGSSISTSGGGGGVGGGGGGSGAF